MPVMINKFLRNALYVDIVFSGIGALLMAGGASVLAPLLGLPKGLLIGAGLVLIPWVIALAMIARRSQVSRIVLVDIVAINVLWAAASLGLLFSGLIAPTLLGIIFVAAQAIAVALFAELEFVGMRRPHAAA